MFDRFTASARKAMALSRKEAQRLCTPYIGTEHMLLGMLGLEPMKGILAQLEIEPTNVRDEVKRRVPRGDKEPGLGMLPFTDRAKKVLELSMEEAHGLDHNFIAIDHLLLGLIREEKGLAGQVLRAMGLDIERVRAVARERNRTTPGESGAGPTSSGLRKKRPWWKFW
jgi:ATP-dependent Clp protease ATP-binding subunit ClpC